MTYKGYIEATEREFADYCEGKNLENLKVNQYVMFNEQAMRFDGKELVHLKIPRAKDFGDFKAKNLHQQMSLDLLFNDKIPAKVITGIAGSGKTRMAIQYGMHMMEKHQKKLFIVRNPVTVGEEIGHLPGDKNEKIAFITKPILDNMPDSDDYQKKLDGLERKMKYGDLEFEVPNYMQGRDIRDAIIIVDEAQMLNIDLVKMLGSRVSEGSQIIFVGDYEQTFHRKYKGENNGLTHMMDKLAGHPLFGCVELQKSVRSETAEMFATLL